MTQAKYSYDYPRPAITVDLVIYVLTGDELRVLVIRRDLEPFAGHMALPGGFVEIGETFEEAARRELREEAGLVLPGDPLAFIGVFGDPGRDPRGRTVSLAHAAAVSQDAFPSSTVRAGDDAREAGWARIDEVRGMAFDHDQILGAARAWLADQIERGPSGMNLLCRHFKRHHVAGCLQMLGLTSIDPDRWIQDRIDEGRARPLKRPGLFAKSKPKVPPPVAPTSYVYPFA